LNKDYFSKNRIQEALCQFAFKLPLDLSKVDDFGKSVIESGKYTKVEDIPLLHFNINFSESHFKPEQNKGLKITNEAGDKVIQVFSDNLSIHQVGNYSTWEDFRDDIFLVLDLFIKIYESELGRIDLRAINNFDFIKEEKQINEFLNFGISVPKMKSPSSTINFSFEQIVTPGKEFISIRSNFNPDQKRMLFDLSYIWFLNDATVKISDRELIRRNLDIGNISLYEIFVSSLKDTAKKILK
jgi:uncharacterized protein (TIGR04255 family)